MTKKRVIADRDEADEAPQRRFPRGVFVTLGGILILALMIGLYQAKAEAQATRKNIANLEKDLRQTRRAISAREAEIAYLERPERLKELARSRLDLAPAQTGQLKSLDELEESADPQAEQSPPVDNR